MSNYPKLTFRSEQASEFCDTRWGVYHRGQYLGSVERRGDFWFIANFSLRYDSRYEAGYQLYRDTHIQ